MYGKAKPQTKTGFSPKCNIILLLKVIFTSFVLLLVYKQFTEVFYELDLRQNMNPLSHQDTSKELGEKNETQFNSTDVLNMKLQITNMFKQYNQMKKSILPNSVNSSSSTYHHVRNSANLSSFIRPGAQLANNNNERIPSNIAHLRSANIENPSILYTKDSINNDQAYVKDTINIPSKPIYEEKKSLKSLGTITIAQMVTEDKDYRYVNQTVVHIKSVMLFTDKPVKYLLFSYDRAPQMVVEQIRTWPEQIRKRLSIQTVKISLDDIPSLGYGITEADIKMIKGVHHMKTHYLLQIMLTMTHLKYIILMDSDSIVISDITETWQQFLHFNESQFAGMGPGGIRYKPKPNQTRRNVYGVIGLNSGVFLLDVEKCRKSKLAQDMIQTLNNHSCSTSDQCVMMRYFVKYPETMYYLPCSYNLHKGLDPCRFTSFRPYCEAIYSEGIYIYHGSASQYLIKGSPYGVLYRMIRDYDFQHDGIRYWEEGLSMYTTAREKCGDASAKRLKYFMQKAMLLK